MELLKILLIAFIFAPQALTSYIADLSEKMLKLLHFLIIVEVYLLT